MSKKEQKSEKAAEPLGEEILSERRSLPTYWKRIIKEEGLDEDKIDKFRDHLDEFSWPSDVERGDSYGQERSE